MKKSLEDQMTFLGSEGSAQTKCIDEQGTLVDEHRQKLAESNDTQMIHRPSFGTPSCRPSCQ